MDNWLIVQYCSKSLNRGGRRKVDQPAVGRAGAKPVGAETGDKRPVELRGDGELVRAEVINPRLPRKAPSEKYCNRTANRHR